MMNISPIDIDNVYIMEIVTKDDKDNRFFVCDTKESAIFIAIDEISYWFMQNDFDNPSNVEEHKIYVKVKKLLDTGSYYDAIDEFDSIGSDARFSHYNWICIHIYRRSVYHRPDNGIGKPEQISGKKEISCPHCGKMNDVDATHCWSLHCGRPLK
jgi:hypothetical protein